MLKKILLNVFEKDVSTVKKITWGNSGLHITYVIKPQKLQNETHYVQDEEKTTKYEQKIHYR
jgi:hypothetical protein